MTGQSEKAEIWAQKSHDFCAGELTVTLSRMRIENGVLSDAARILVSQPRGDERLFESVSVGSCVRYVSAKSGYMYEVRLLRYNPLLSGGVATISVDEIRDQDDIARLGKL